MRPAALLPVHCDFPRSYEFKVLESYPLVNPAEEFHQFPTRLEEGDRTGIYLRVMPPGAAPWVGFFAQGFASDQVANGIYSCPAPQSICVAASGYAYLVDAVNPQNWLQIEQRPVVEVRPIPALKLLLLIGFTTITALGTDGQLWTTERLSWEGLSIRDVQGTVLHGMGWDLMADKEVPFELDLLTGISKGGARPK
jgi:hypothetical protein